MLQNGELPPNWTTGSLLDIADYLNGLAMQKFRPVDGERGLPVLKIKELRQGFCDYSSELCSPNIKPEFIVHDGDVIFSWSGSLLVDLWCGGTCGLNQHLFKVTSVKYPKWFYYTWTAHHLARFVAIAADKATTMGHIKREDLAKAEHFIFMEYHAIEDAEAWQRIQQVLEERVNAGVEVRVFYDDMGSIGFINTDFIKKLDAVGIQCRVFNPFMPGLNVFLNNRDHRKITVIDGKVGFTGGYNLANEYFNLTHPYGQWKDTGIRLEGEAVRSLTVTFLEMWNAVSDKDKNDSDFNKFLPDYKYVSSQTGFIQPYADSPLDNEQVGEEVYISMVNKSEKYCWFMTPYLIITDEMAHAITLAAKRGVDVRIITPGIPDKKMIYSVTRSFYHELVKDGVRIYEWTPGFCHAKMSVADDCMATCGTINLDYRSLYHHFENGCFMADCEVVSEIRNDLQETMKECREVTEKYHTGRSAYLRLSQLFMRLFAGLL